MNLTRRRLLQGAGGVIAAAVFPKRPALAGEPPGPVMTKLSAYMSEARNRALPSEVLEKAKHHILDTFAAMISGAELPRSEERRVGKEGRSRWSAGGSRK